GADEVEMLGETWDEDGARGVKRPGDIGDTLRRVDKSGGRLVRMLLRACKQRLCKRLEAGLAGSLALGPTLRLVREVEILKSRLGVSRRDRPLELGRELPLLADAGENCGAALLEFPQIPKPLLQRP